MATAPVHTDRENTLTDEENYLLTRVGPGTLMGDLFRQYWIPVIPTLFLKDPGGIPKRVSLLGEDLLAFRTRGGEVGLVGAYCSHRLAPLYFGHIENDGIRCPYHGWKYAPGGKCIEMPNVAPGAEFMDRIHHPGYPCVEYGGVIWTYMGPSKELPPFPEFEFAMIPDDQRRFRLFHQECNYLQALEGGIDPTHVMWLHSPYDLSDNELARRHQPVQQIVAGKSGARTPLSIEIVDTAGGFMYGAKRPMGEEQSLWRVNQFLMPFYTMPPGGDIRQGRMWIPIDDENCVKWYINWFPTRSIMESTTEKLRIFDEEAYVPQIHKPYAFIRARAQKANDYLIDWEMHTTRRMESQESICKIGVSRKTRDPLRFWTGPRRTSVRGTCPSSRPARCCWGPLERCGSRARYHREFRNRALTDFVVLPSWCLTTSIGAKA